MHAEPGRFLACSFTIFTLPDRSLPREPTGKAWQGLETFKPGSLAIVTDVENNAAMSYRTSSVTDVPPVKAVAILYDKAIEALQTAIHMIEEGDVQGRWEANKKAGDIITNLSACLDHDQGGEIAENLEQLYRFMLIRLMDVDMKNDPKAAREVIKLLQPLRRSWHQLAGMPEDELAAAQAKALKEIRLQKKKEEAEAAPQAPQPVPAEALEGLQGPITV